MGLHLRGKRHQAAEAGRFHWRVDDVWPRLRDEVKKRKGGLFVAADGHLALLPGISYPLLQIPLPLASRMGVLSVMPL